MKLELCLFTVLLSGALAVMSHGNSGFGGWGGRMVVSRRDAAAAAAADTGSDAEESEEPDLYGMVNAMLSNAAKGMTMDDMGKAAAEIRSAADKAVDDAGGKVEASDVQAAIDTAASTLSGAVAVSALFDEPLVYEANKMDAALCLLNILAQTARAQDEAGESSDATKAAISMTVQAIQNILGDTVGIITFDASLAEGKNVNKRWEVTGNVDRDPFGRYSYGVGISHSWNGRRKRSTYQRTKRGRWDAGVNVNRGYGGGYSVGASVSYSWGK